MARRRLRGARALLDGVNAAVVAGMFVVAVRLAVGVAEFGLQLVIFGLSVVL